MFCCLGSSQVKDRDQPKATVSTASSAPSQPQQPTPNLQAPISSTAHVTEDKSQPVVPEPNVSTTVSEPVEGNSSAKGLSSPVEAFPPVPPQREVRQLLAKVMQHKSILLDGLIQATEEIVTTLGASSCCVYSAPNDTGCVLLAASGLGRNELESSPVLKGTSFSTGLVHHTRQSLYHTIPDASSATVSTLPHDWKALAEGNALRSFLAVPIFTSNQQVLGVLSICHTQQNAFQGDGWSDVMDMLSVGFTASLKEPHLREFIHTLYVASSLEQAHDFVALMLQSIAVLLQHDCKMEFNCRLAITNLAAGRALVFETDPNHAAQNCPAHVFASEIPTSNTMLIDCVTNSKARFVSDCATYLHAVVHPATDIFIASSTPVASVVVLPLLHATGTMGALYFCRPVPTNFIPMKPVLVGTANIIAMHVGQRVATGGLQALWDAVLQRSSMDAAALAAQEKSTGLRLPQIKVMRNCTESMMQVVQAELAASSRKATRRTSMDYVPDLVAHEQLGRGARGQVYKGLYKGGVVAIKVIVTKEHERQAMKDAMEMAVLTSISHPNTIQVYECLVNMVEQVEQQGESVAIRFRPLQPEEQAASCSVLVMEYCEMGTLRQAIKALFFHRKVGRASIAVDMSTTIEVLLEVARAVQHLHDHSVVHGDIKPENVLVKADATKRNIITTKLTDFGLAKLLRDSYYVVNHSGSGTATHLAPEFFQEGSKITAKVDTYAFGIVMWEMYCGRRAFSGMDRESIMVRVYREGARPQFPPGCPAGYSGLAQRCWAQDYHDRPDFDELVGALAGMLAELQQPEPQQVLQA